MRILALDLGTYAGWALSTSDHAFIYASGAWDFSGGRNKKYEGAGMRFLRFNGMLDEIHARTPLDQIAFESVRRHIGVDAAHAYGGFMSHLEAWGERNTVPYEGVPVGTIKKFATGKGNAKKDAMILAAKAWGFNPASDDEADAIALLKCVIAGLPKPKQVAA